MISKFISIDDIKTKATLSFIDIITGLLLLIIGLKIKSSVTSNVISQIVTVATIIPGILLTLFTRKILVGNSISIESMFKNMRLCFFINLILLSYFSFYMLEIFHTSIQYIFLMFFLCLYLSLCSIYLPLSVIWFSLSKNNILFFKVKVFVSSLRLLSAVLALCFQEKSLFILVLATTPFIEFLFFKKNVSNFLLSTLTANQDKKGDNLFSLSLGMVRGLTSIIKIQIDRIFPGVLSTIIIFEAVFAGVLSLYERYFMKDLKPFKILINLKVFWSIILLLIFMFYNFDEPFSLKSKFILFLLTSSTVLPSVLMYDSLKINGVRFVATINILTFVILVMVFISNLFIFKIQSLFLLLYILIPILIFLFCFILSKRRKTF